MLYRAFANGHPYLWFFGSVASLLTACYMFRLVFLTFHGKRAEEAPAADRAGHGSAHGGHGAPGGHLHDAPRPMAIALVVLAVGAVLAGYVGVPARARRLEPDRALPRAELRRSQTRRTRPARRSTRLRRPARRRAEPGDGHAALEGRLMARLDAGRVHRHRPRVAVLPEAARPRRRGGVPVPRAAPAAAEQVLRGRDLRRGHRPAGAHRVGAGAVEGCGRGGHRRRGERRRRDRAGRSAAVLRLLQTGSVRAYAASLIIGAVLILAYLPVATVGRQS